MSICSVSYRLKPFKSNVTDMCFFTNIYYMYVNNSFLCFCLLMSLGVGKGTADNFKMEMSQVGFSAHQTRNKVPALYVGVFPSMFLDVFFLLVVYIESWL